MTRREPSIPRFLAACGAIGAVLTGLRGWLSFDGDEGT